MEKVISTASTLIVLFTASLYFSGYTYIDAYYDFYGIGLNEIDLGTFEIIAQGFAVFDSMTANLIGIKDYVAITFFFLVSVAVLQVFKLWGDFRYVFYSIYMFIILTGLLFSVTVLRDFAASSGDTKATFDLTIQREAHVHHLDTRLCPQSPQQPADQESVAATIFGIPCSRIDLLRHIYSNSDFHYIVAMLNEGTWWMLRLPTQNYDIGVFK